MACKCLKSERKTKSVKRKKKYEPTLSEVGQLIKCVERTLIVGKHSTWIQLILSNLERFTLW